MAAKHQIRKALERKGVTDVLVWARERTAVPLLDLNEDLDAGVAPVDLEHFMAVEARRAGSYDDFVRVEACRRLNEYFPEGVGASDNPQYGYAAGWAMWSGLHEPGRMVRAKRVWDALCRTMEKNPSWCPETPDDPALVDAFSAETSFEVSAEFAQLQEVLDRVWELAEGGGDEWSEKAVADSFASVPAGYGMLYGAWVLVGEVENGGFWQFYYNGGAASVGLAVKALDAMGKVDLAKVVRQSRLRRGPAGKILGLLLWVVSGGVLPRSLSALDERFYGLCEMEGEDWLEISAMRLISSEPSLFERVPPNKR